MAKHRNFIWKEANEARGTRWPTGPHGDDKKQKAKKDRKKVKQKLKKGEDV